MPTISKINGYDIKDNTLETMEQTEADTGTSTDGKLISPKVLHDAIVSCINSLDATNVAY